MNIPPQLSIYRARSLKLSVLRTIRAVAYSTLPEIVLITGLGRKHRCIAYVLYSLCDSNI